MHRLVRDILEDTPSVRPDCRGEDVYDMFSEDEDLMAIAVVENDQPLGLIGRDQFFLKMADRHGRALFSRRPITAVMNDQPLMVDARTPVDELNNKIVRSNPSALKEGFIATSQGNYVGVGTGLALFTAMANHPEERNHKLSALAEQLGRARIEALAASKSKSDFLATMSHEIRTPLNGVLGIAQLLMSTGLSEEQAEFVRVIDDSGQVLLRLLNDILDLSKIEAGKMELDIQPFNVRLLANDAYALWSSQARQKNIRFDIDFADGQARKLKGDAIRLKQILFNLIGNAIKFTREGSVDVCLSLHDIGQRRTVLRSEIRDTGCGIPDSAQLRMFQTFSQADAATTREHGGSGLGLAICKRLVDLMGGTIGFESQEGQGSTFWFEVPLKTAEKAQPQPASSEAQGPVADLRPGARILVAEDNRVNQTVTQGFLKLKGLQAEIVENGRLALEAAGTTHYDLILMDMEMPVMDGLEATRAIRRLPAPLCEVPIVALTAHALSGAADRCRAAGMNGHLAKPIEKDALFTTIDDALAGRLKTPPTDIAV